MERIRIAYGAKIPVILTIAERDLIRAATFYDSEFARTAEVKGDKVYLDLSMDQVEDLQGFIAAGANHAEDKSLERELHQVFDKLQAYLDTYTEEDELL